VHVDGAHKPKKTQQVGGRQNNDLSKVNVEAEKAAKWMIVKWVAIGS